MIKVKLHTSVCICLLFGISLIFYPTFGSFLDGISHSSKVGRHIMESYYEKHESFIDSLFDDFLTQDLPVNICEVLPCDLNTVLSLSIRSRIKGDGSHRQLSSTIKFNIEKSLSQVLTHRLFSDVAVFGDTNLELPSVLSNISVIEVHKDIGLNTLSHNKNLLDFTVDLPLHSRYPRLDESGYVKVRLKAPDLFLQCSIQEKPDNRSCFFKLETDDEEADLTWSIPAGKRSDAGIVTAVTFVSAFLSVLCIVFLHNLDNPKF
ncbi:uncharacterized protein LOC103488085 [Cucumis melo]|uniref:Uncharacterized protein LOC103488085 n=2 Tax=Cucumis melo TaxID=3656 RepID=A0A1S3BAW3_CUCME|nr:uncharacterized protein LOC103488085 [Cucumis melo]XP_008444869.1 uncharacterized protein LOC103488085 [Cucumis melo]XP_008444870.1 uncharacterized protein LOC103488085 [Cucumis melo]